MISSTKYIVHQLLYSFWTSSNTTTILCDHHDQPSSGRSYNNSTLSIGTEWFPTPELTATQQEMGTPAKGQHKPRRKLKNSDDNGAQLTKSETLYRAPSFPLAAFLWPARGSVSPWEGLPLILMVVGLFRWAAGLWGYSGEQH